MHRKTERKKKNIHGKMDVHNPPFPGKSVSNVICTNKYLNWITGKGYINPKTLRDPIPHTFYWSPLASNQVILMAYL